MADSPRLHVFPRVFCLGWLLACFPAPFASLGAADGPAGPTRFRVRVEAPQAAPLVARTVAILKDRIEQRSTVQVIAGDADPDLALAIDTTLPADGFRIEDAHGAVRIAGGSPRGLLYGVGKFLHTSHYGPTFRPSRWRGTTQPRGAVRGMYFATHFRNWHHVASEAEVTRYLEDLALWGMNTVKAVVPMITLHGWDDPATAPAMDMVRRYARISHELDLMFCTGFGNAMFMDAPASIRAKPLADPLGRRGNSGYPVCPSNPQGREYLLENTRELCRRLQDTGLDAMSFWPYDEGGCPCEQCRPWGSNGFLRMSREMTAVAREYFPQLKSILSTWAFDTPPEGEWSGLSAALANGGEPWLNYILADAHEDFPRYPLESGVPGGRPLLNFPEISMWGNSPWGGFGANPLPNRLQRLWDQVKHAVEGGFPYSEGIYEDMNKVVELQFYWDSQRTARDTLREYSDYEYGAGVADDVVALVYGLEEAASRSFQRETVNATSVLDGWRLAESIDGRLPDWARHGWRWEIVHLRALLDRERFAGGDLDGPTAQAAMLRLAEIYHCELVTDDPYHARVRPPLRNAVNRAGVK